MKAKKRLLWEVRCLTAESNVMTADVEARDVEAAMAAVREFGTVFIYSVKTRKPKPEEITPE